MLTMFTGAEEVPRISERRRHAVQRPKRRGVQEGRRTGVVQQQETGTIFGSESRNNSKVKQDFPGASQGRRRVCNNVGTLRTTSKDPRYKLLPATNLYSGRAIVRQGADRSSGARQAQTSD